MLSGSSASLSYWYGTWDVVHRAPQTAAQAILCRCVGDGTVAVPTEASHLAMLGRTWPLGKYKKEKLSGMWPQQWEIQWIRAQPLPVPVVPFVFSGSPAKC